MRGRAAGFIVPSSAFGISGGLQRGNIPAYGGSHRGIMAPRVFLGKYQREVYYPDTMNGTKVPKHGSTSHGMRQLEARAEHAPYVPFVDVTTSVDVGPKF